MRNPIGFRSRACRTESVHLSDGLVERNRYQGIDWHEKISVEIVQGILSASYEFQKRYRWLLSDP